MAISPDDLANALYSLAEGLRGVGPSRPLTAPLAEVVTAAQAMLEADCVGLLLLDEHDQLRTTATTGPAARALEAAQVELSVGPGVDVIAAGRVVAVTDLAAVPAYARLWRRVEPDGVRAVLSAPVTVDGETIGNLNIIKRRPFAWAAESVAGAGAFGDVVAAMLNLVAFPAALTVLPVANGHLPPANGHPRSAGAAESTGSDGERHADPPKPGGEDR